jgi:hypothetical protein
VTAKPRLLLDEMLSGHIAEQLRDSRLDVLAVIDDVALRSMPDEDLLAHAATEQRCLVTANIGDFAVIATEWRASGRTHAGLVYVVNRVFPHNRSLIGALVSSLANLVENEGLPTPGSETFLDR